ncbi:MAG: hypothetical protein JXQ73_26060 [Phycisphaerae bacterium]|nr:hypothetical protein [Phycisphaerae bacterium]
MIPWVLATIGRSERLDAMRRGFTSKSEPGSGAWTGLLVVLILIVAAILILLLVNRYQQGKAGARHSGAAGLFKEVLQKLPLGLQDRALLRRLASDMDLPNPTVMLLTPKLFAEISYTYVAGKPGETGSDLSRLASICKLLFGHDMPRPQPGEFEGEKGSGHSSGAPREDTASRTRFQ